MWNNRETNDVIADGSNNIDDTGDNSTDHDGDNSADNCTNLGVNDEEVAGCSRDDINKEPEQDYRGDNQIIYLHYNLYLVRSYCHV